MAGKVRNFFAAGHTARGYYSLFNSVLAGLDRLYFLIGGPCTGQSTVIKQIGDTMSSRGYDIELLHCASDDASVDGVIVPELKLGVVDGTAVRTVEPQAPGAVEEYVSIGGAWDLNQLRKQKEHILTRNKQMTKTFQQAYNTFADALRIHDEWEKIYIDNLDPVKANNLAHRVIEQMFSNKALTKPSHARHMFLGAATPKGPVDFVQNLTEEMDKRYFIKGRPGSGKSSMLKKVAAAAKERGFDVEIYHCGFDPHSLDMVLLPELKTAIFDSTAPHEHFPDREGDEVIDMYAHAIAPGTDETHATQINDIRERYSAKMQQATSCLSQGKELRDQLDAIYRHATDFAKLKEIQTGIQAEIDAFAAEQATV